MNAWLSISADNFELGGKYEKLISLKTFKGYVDYFSNGRIPYWLYVSKVEK